MKLKRYNQNIAGRVTPNIRNTIRPHLQAFAQSQQLPFNTVFGAVTFAAEQLSGRVTLERVLSLVNQHTVDYYQQERERIAQARLAQLTGMARRALPALRQHPRLIQKLVAQAANFEGSIPELNAHLRYLAQKLPA